VSLIVPYTRVIRWRFLQVPSVIDENSERLNAPSGKRFLGDVTILEQA
jgi:hypothetical protein